MTIEKILKHNPTLLSDFLAQYGSNTEYLQEISDIYSKLNESNCENLEEKCRDINKSGKLHSTLSEFKCAKFFLDSGYNVKFIPDSDNNGKKSPDIQVKKNGKEILIEVYHMNSGDAATKILTKLREIVPNTPYIIRFDVDYELSHSCLTHSIHKQHDLIIDSCISSFLEELSRVKPSSYPYTIETPHISFQITGMCDGDSGYLGSLSSGSEVDLPYLTSNLNYWITKKAKKRLDFITSYPNIPYVISIISDEMMLDHREVKMALNQLFASTQIIPDISGVIFRDFRGNFVYYPNPNSKQEIKMDLL